MTKTPKSIDEWGLDRKALRIVKRNLRQWLKLFRKHANGREGTIYRANVRQQDYFYFTDCTDILGKEVESTGQESNKDITMRKCAVMNQIIIRVLLGEKIGIKTRCSHCGHPEVYINGINGGHYDFCPECGKTVVVTYPAYYSSSMENVRNDIRKKFDKWDKMYNEIEETIKKYKDDK